MTNHDSAAADPRAPWWTTGKLTLRDAVVIGLLAGLAFLGNYFPVSLVFGIDILLGGIFIYLLLLQYGLLLALLASLPALAATYLLWDHAVGAVLLTLELMALAYLMRRWPGQEPPLLMVFIWVPWGAALSFTLYYLVVDLQVLDSGLVALKQGINSITAITVALVLHFLLAPRWLPRGGDAITGRELMFYVPAALVILVIFLVIFFISQVQLRAIESRFFDRLANAQLDLLTDAQALVNELESDLTRIESRCFSRRSTPISSASCLETLVPFTRWDEVYFQTPEDAVWWDFESGNLFPRQADQNGRAKAFAQFQSRMPHARFVVSDDGWLRLFMPRSTSPEVWVGAGLNVSAGKHQFWPQVETDHQRRSWQVNGAEMSASAPPLTNQVRPEQFVVQSMPTSVREPDLTMAHALPDLMGPRNPIKLWGGSVYYMQTELSGLGLPGALRVEVSPRPEQEIMYRTYALVLPIALGLMVLALWVVRGATDWVLSPMRKLVATARDIPSQLDTPPEYWQWPGRRTIREVDELTESLQGMGQMLYARYQRDIKSRAELEQQVKTQSRDLFEVQQHINSILQNVDGAMWSGTLDNDRLTLNLMSPGIFRLTGFAPDQWVQDTSFLFERIDTDGQRQMASAVQNIKQGSNGELELLFRHANGELKALRVRFWIVYDEFGRPKRVDGLATDISAWREAQEQIETQNQMLALQARRAAMGEMISNIAHQWRQPLNSLRLIHANLLDAQDYGELTADALADGLQKSDDLIEGMNQTVHDFLTFFRPQKEASAFDLTGVVQEALKVMDSTLTEYPVTLSSELAPEVTAWGFGNEVLQTLLVIMQNAREVLRDREIQSGTIHIRLTVSGPEAIVAISDNAGGVPPEICDAIFDPYFTTRADGTGIGLYMAKTLIEGQMQGSIRLRNNAEGATFEVVLATASASPPGHLL